MQQTTTVIIGAGQSGLAFSHELARHGIDHVVLERGQAANSWRTERWDSLSLLTPNWMNGLPGNAYTGPDPDGFMNVDELVARFDQAVRRNGTPIQSHTNVLSVAPHFDGYKVQTDRGAIRCSAVVMANGACALPKIPGFARELPSGIPTVTPLDYKRSDDLPDGEILVVGASSSGIQIARELQLSGRQVTLAVGSHTRVPRTYRGRDIFAWLDTIGAIDVSHREVDDIERVRRTASLALIGHPERIDIDLNALQALGIEITGRMAGVNEDRAVFSGSLHNMCAAADLKMNRLLRSIDDWIDARGVGAPPPAADYKPTRVPDAPRLARRLGKGGIAAIVWATGFAPDFSWLDMPVFDRKGRLAHDGGVVAPGLYAMGQTYMRTRKSTLIHGAQDDARHLAAHLMAGLNHRIAA